MSIKNPHIIHFVRSKRYICIGAVIPTKEKSTYLRDRVTCKRCKHILKMEKKKNGKTRR